MPCCPCNPCTYGCPASGTAFDDDALLECFAYQYSVVLSGFTGACAVFNGTWTATWKGKSATVTGSCPGNCADISGFQPPIIWTANVDTPTQSFIRLYTALSPAGSALSMFVCLYQGGVVVWSGSARVITSVPSDCNNPAFSLALPRASGSCAGGACTVSWSDTPGWSCDCNGTPSSPTPVTLTLTVTNSTYATLPNGTYTMSRHATFGGLNDYNSYWEYPDASNPSTFWIDISGNNGTCTGRAFRPKFAAVSFANAGCTCNPITASGHAICPGGTSLDWSVSG